MATGFHGFHVLVGTCFLVVCWFRGRAGHFNPSITSDLRQLHGTGILLMLFGSFYSSASIGGVADKSAIIFSLVVP